MPVSNSRLGHTRALIIAAGSPNKRKPAMFRTLAPGQSVVLVTKQRRIIFVSARRDADGIPLLVGVGTGRTSTPSGPG